MSRRSSNGSTNDNMNFEQENQMDFINNQTTNKETNFIRFDNQTNIIDNSIPINNTHMSTRSNEISINYETG
jgi:hypothetical protein